MEQIKNRFTGEIMCGGLSLKIVLGNHIKWLRDEKDGALADLARADLAGADLADANLAGAYLADANLAGANLADANLAHGVKAYGHKFYRAPIQISDKYRIDLWDGFLKIGCERHLLSEWASFTNKQIIEMDGKDAAQWWEKWKPILFAMAEATGRMKLPKQDEVRDDN